MIATHVKTNRQQEVLPALLSMKKIDINAEYYHLSGNCVTLYVNEYEKATNDVDLDWTYKIGSSHYKTIGTNTIDYFQDQEIYREKSERIINIKEIKEILTKEFPTMYFDEIRLYFFPYLVYQEGNSEIRISIEFYGDDYSIKYGTGKKKSQSTKVAMCKTAAELVSLIRTDQESKVKVLEYGQLSLF